jgi:hypothetical protein
MFRKRRSPPPPTTIPSPSRAEVNRAYAAWASAKHKAYVEAGSPTQPCRAPYPTNDPETRRAELGEWARGYCQYLSGPTDCQDEGWCKLVWLLSRGMESEAVAYLAVYPI